MNDRRIFLKERDITSAIELLEQDAVGLVCKTLYLPWRTTILGPGLQIQPVDSSGNSKTCYYNVSGTGSLLKNYIYSMPGLYINYTSFGQLSTSSTVYYYPTVMKTLSNYSDYNNASTYPIGFRESTYTRYFGIFLPAAEYIAIDFNYLCYADSNFSQADDIYLKILRVDDSTKFNNLTAEYPIYYSNE